MALAISPARSKFVISWLAFAMGLAMPVSTAMLSIASVGILMVWLLSGDWQMRWQALRSNPVVLPMALMILLAFAGVFWGRAPIETGFGQFGKYSSFLLSLCLISLALEPANRRRALLGFGVGVVVTFSLSYALRLGLLPIERFRQATLDNPLPFKMQITHGFFMALGAYFFLVSALNASEVLWRRVFGVCALLAAINVFMVQGRTGYLVLAVLGAYLLIRRFRWQGIAIFLVLAVAGGGLAMQYPDAPVTKRFVKAAKEIREWQPDVVDNGSSMGLRLQYAMASLKIISEHPLAGVGTGGFGPAYSEVAPQDPKGSVNPHNQYLLTTAQFGLPGLVLLLTLLVVLWRTSAHLAIPERTLARGILLAYAVGCLFNSFLYDYSEVRFFAWSMGLLFSGFVGTRAHAEQLSSAAGGQLPSKS